MKEDCVNKWRSNKNTTTKITLTALVIYAFNSIRDVSALSWNEHAFQKLYPSYHDGYVLET